MLIDISLIVLGFGLLVVGGEVLVQGAVQLAGRLRLSTFVIGAVVIGFGSSMPELVTSIEAGLLGAPGIALGNIVGSNIINILVVIGVAALISPITPSARHLRVETIVVFVITAAFVALCATLELTPVIGAMALVALAVYLIYAVRRETTTAASSTDTQLAHEAATQAGSTPTTGRLQNGSLRIGCLVVTGLALLVFGGHLVVASAVSIAQASGVDESLIGLTIVAFGTSLPEIVTAIVAAYRRQADVALGNVLGSCVFNLLAIGGVIAIISPADMPPEIVRFDNLVMLAAALLLLLTISLSRQINRPLGAVFLGGYAIYLTAIWP